MLFPKHDSVLDLQRQGQDGAVHLPLHLLPSSIKSRTILSGLEIVLRTPYRWDRLRLVAVFHEYVSVVRKGAVRTSSKLGLGMLICHLRGDFVIG